MSNLRLAQLGGKPANQPLVMVDAGTHGTDQTGKLAVENRRETLDEPVAPAVGRQPRNPLPREVVGRRIPQPAAVATRVEKPAL